MRRAIGLLAVLGLLGVNEAFAAEPDLSGSYAMKGTSLRPNSRPYIGECNLARAGQVYDVNCVNTDSGDKYEGKGIQRGDQFSLYLGEYLLVYRVDAAGNLAGNWAHARSDDYGEETMVRK